MTSIEICPKCSGRKILDWTMQDGGVCYKCEGKGYLGIENDEFTAIIDAMEQKRKDASFIYDVIKHLNKSIDKSGRFYSYGTCSEIALGYMSTTKVFNVSEKIANLFEVPYLNNYSDIFNCLNPSERTLKHRVQLEGHYTIIEKINDKQIRYSIK